MTAKIVHIITRIVGGGGEKNTLETIHGLCDKGYGVHLMHGGQSEANALQRFDLPSEVTIIEIPELVREVSPLKDYAAYRKMVHYIETEKYDIVHTHLAKAGVLGRMAAKRAGHGIVVHGIHGISFPRTIHPLKRLLFRQVERYCATHTDHFIPVGVDVRDQYISAGIGSKDRHTIVRSAIDIEKYEKAMKMAGVEKERVRASMGLHSDDIVVGMVSKLEKRKGYGYYLEAASRIVSRNPNVKFVVVGDGQELEALQEQAGKLGITDNVIFAGYRRDIAEVISIFDVAVLTSLWEGLPQYLVQASLLSKPIVAFDVDGVREVVEDGANGYAVPVGDVDALVRGIEWLAVNEDIRVMMGAESGRRVDRTCTRENMVGKTEMVYQLLMKRSNHV